jgi:hypothetical protein
LIIDKIDAIDATGPRAGSPIVAARGNVGGLPNMTTREYYGYDGHHG